MAVGTVLQHTLFVIEILNSRISSSEVGVNVGNKLHFFFRHQKQRVSIFCSRSSSYLTGIFINMLRFSQHCVPCFGFVCISIHINSVGQCSSSASPSSILSFVRKNFAFVCFVCFELDRGPLINSRMLDWLSWCRILCSTVYPCASIKYFVHNACGRISSVPTSCVSVELLVSVFCPLQILVVAPYPRVSAFVRSWKTINVVLHPIVLEVGLQAFMSLAV